MKSRAWTWIAISVAFALLLLALWLVLLKYRNAQQKLDEAASLIESIGQSSFFVEADVSDTIPVSTFITIPMSIPVDVCMSMRIDAPLNMQVPVRKDLNIPFALSIREVIPVDTTFSFPEGMNPFVNDTLDMQSRMKIKFWPGFRIPFRVEGSIPIKQNLSLDMQTIRVSADIPIAMNIEDNIPVRLDFSIPVSDTLNLPINIRTRAMITFVEKIPIEADFPIQLKAPVKVDFATTPLKNKFDSLARVLRQVL